MPEILKHTRENVAHHEAGHAVIAYLTGFYVIDGPIDIDGEGSDGHYAETPILEDDALLAERIQEGWVIDHFVKLKQQTAFAVAGFTAEMFLAEENGTAFDDDLAFKGALGDRKQVLEYWKGPNSFRELSRLLIHSMVEEEVWSMISILAKALLAQEGSMPAEKVMEILQRSKADTGAKFRLFFKNVKQPPKPEVSPDTVPPQ